MPQSIQELVIAFWDFQSSCSLVYALASHGKLCAQWKWITGQNIVKTAYSLLSFANNGILKLIGLTRFLVNQFYLKCYFFWLPYSHHAKYWACLDVILGPESFTYKLKFFVSLNILQWSKYNLTYGWVKTSRCQQKLYSSKNILGPVFEAGSPLPM